MSCNGCRVLRKGCSEGCVLRPCLEWIDGADSQGHATVFLAKFFGRAGLMSFISAVPDSRRPALFQSLLYEACGRTVNPVGGAVGLLWSGNWEACRAAVEAVLGGGGGALRPVEPGLADVELGGGGIGGGGIGGSPGRKRRNDRPEQECDLDLCLTPRAAEGRKRRPTTPSMNSEGSMTTASGADDGAGVGPARLLNLFV